MTDSFLQHVAKATSQYDDLCRSLAVEVLQRRRQREHTLIGFVILLVCGLGMGFALGGLFL